MKGLLRQAPEAGTVLVLVAAAMFPLAGMLAFAIDTSHWFDYSRNLQNRADAAAFAAGDQYGNLCFLGNAGDVWTGAQSAIGKWAQLYAGPGTQTGDGTTAQGSAGGGANTNVPYTDSSVFSTTGAAAYKNVPNLTKGLLNHYYVRLNATNYYDKGATPPPNFGMGDFCTSTPAADFSDTGSAGGPMVDVKVTQYQLGNFLPIFGALTPNIEAHARVQLQGEASSSDVRPIAVRDAGFTPCVSVQFMNATTNLPIGSPVALTKEAAPGPGGTVVWDNNGSPTQVAIPAGANAYVQPILSNCLGNNQTYDDSTNNGLLYINSHPTTDPTVNAGQPPQLTTGGVFLTGTCSPDPYFSVGGCTATLNAYVKFAQSVDSGNKTKVFAVPHYYDNTTGHFVTGSPISLSQDNHDRTHWSANVTIADTSGMTQWEITWEQDAGGVNGTTTQCGDGNGSHPAPCTGTYGIQQQGFGACDGCDQPDDSGPIVLMQLSQPNVGSLTNSLPAGTNQQLVVTLELSGIAASVGGDPATILRFGGGQQTGLVNCGQGNGAGPADYNAIYYGCGPSNTHFTPPLNPLYVNTRNGDCSQPWPSINHQDCVQTTPGERRQQIPGALVDRITTNESTCPTNKWTAANNYKVDSDHDPRAVTFIVTSDVDLTLAHNGSQAWIPIWQFATFYVTGWDTSITNICNGQNEAFPIKGKKNQQNGAIWGHWIKYTDVGFGNGAGCTNTNTLGNCVPVLTR